MSGSEKAPPALQAGRFTKEKNVAARERQRRVTSPRRAESY